ncbi:GNAT family N-acetyltransferase [Branchiibius sp. NY16-3462-2]|uniref:GNAT family N-acetyltransferase n=1 Tax=Branchiibius sp. NY16-3462-2 TaxID=1807500 RepID=UPI0025C02D80|nr:GNAT family N-acetyltransferase [Branchiibius sp. NY16-3462-2]
MDERYELIDGPPPLADYLRLRAGSGLTPKRPDQAAPALTNSWAWCHVAESATGAVVGMGRVIGDGGWYFHLADMATDPQYQRQGIGRAVIDRLLGLIQQHAPEDPYVTLMADGPGVRLYESVGFVPSAPGTIGMVLRSRPARESAESGRLPQ